VQAIEKGKRASGDDCCVLARKVGRSFDPLFISLFHSGLPDGFFSNQKSKFG
jgi:hypothetical protein